MPTYDTIKLDGNGRPIIGPMFPFVVKKTMVFAGGTTNDPGDHDGTGDPATLFKVTGDVLVKVIGICKDTLVGAATIEVGVTDATAALLPQIANATSLVVNECWADATPTLAEAISQTYNVIGGGLDIIQTVGTANITAGTIDYYCFYQPLSDDGMVESA
jgi:hypothetical protein